MSQSDEFLKTADDPTPDPLANTGKESLGPSGKPSGQPGQQPGTGLSSGHSSGPPPADAGPTSWATVHEALRDKLGIDVFQTIDDRKAAELVGALIDLAAGVDRVVWGTWSRRLAPASTLRSNGPITRFAKEHLVATKAPESSAPVTHASGALPTEARRLLEMTVALTSSVGQAGSIFAERFSLHLSPDAIEDALADAARARNREAECWKVFRQRAGGIERATIDADITQAAARGVEEWMTRTNKDRPTT